MTKIRPYKTSDYEDLKKLLIDTNLYYEVIDTKEHFERKVKKDASSILVAAYGQTVVGTVFLLEDSGWVAFIFHLAVDKSYRGQGIGKKLMAEAEKIIKSRNGYQVHLLIDTENIEVVDFYKKLGYKESNLYRWMEKDL